MRRSLSDIVPTFLVAAVLGVAAYLVLNATLFPGEDKYKVRFELADAGGILKHYNVKIGGVTAGQVQSISLQPDDDAIVTAELDKSAAPIGAGASAKVRPVNLLGEKYIELDPGDLRRPLPSGSTITKARTAVPIELDDALNTFDPDTRARLRILINEAGVAMMGRGTDFNATLRSLPPALDEMRNVVGQVAAENKQLEAAITQGDSVIADISAGRDDLSELVDSAGGAFQTLAERRSELAATIRQAPAGFSQLRRTLQQLQASAGQLTPAAADLRRTSPALADTLRRVPQFAADAKDALKAAREVSPELVRLGRESRGPLRHLRPTSARLAQFVADLQPLVDVADKGDGLKDFLGFMDGWAGVTDDADGLGHSFRLRATLDEELVKGTLDRYASLLPKSRRKQKTDRDTPAGKQRPQHNPVAEVPQKVGDVTKKVGDAGRSLGDTVKAAATGLLDYLLKP